MRAILHRLLRWMLRAACHGYYRRIVVSRAEGSPEQGPLLLVANHPNSLVDPFLILLQFGPRVHFLAKSGLMNNVIQRYLMESFGVIPVTRRDEADAAQRQQKNEEVFARCRRILEAGGIVAIFPEGWSHADPLLYRLRTGAARIALETEAAHGYGLGVKVAPVGLNYEHGARFRSGVHIHFGPALDTRPHAARHATQPASAVEDLTAALRAALLGCMVQIDSQEEAELIRRVEALYVEEGLHLKPGRPAAGASGAGADPAERLQRLRRFADAYRRMRRDEPERATVLRVRLRRYFDLTAQLGLTDLGSEREYTLRRVLLFILRNAATVGIGFPLYLWGRLNHFLPVILPRKIAAAWSGNEDRIATYRIYAALVAFPLFYALQTALVFWLAGPRAALVYGLSLPLLGIFTLRFREARHYMMSRITAFFVSMSRARLVLRLSEMRTQIVAEVDALADHYLKTYKDLPLEDQPKPIDPFAGRT